MADYVQELTLVLWMGEKTSKEQITPQLLFRFLKKTSSKGEFTDNWKNNKGNGGKKRHHEKRVVTWEMPWGHPQREKTGGKKKRQVDIHKKQLFFPILMFTTQRRGRAESRGSAKRHWAAVQYFPPKDKRAKPTTKTSNDNNNNTNKNRFHSSFCLSSVLSLESTSSGVSRMNVTRGAMRD